MLIEELQLWTNQFVSINRTPEKTNLILIVSVIAQNMDIMKNGVCLCWKCVVLSRIEVGSYYRFCFGRTIHPSDAC